MKFIKYLLWLIVVCLLGILVWQNLDYFSTKTVLTLDLWVENWKWEIPELHNGVYFTICFALGLLLTGFKAIAIKFRLNKKIKTQNNQITLLKKEVNILKTELEVFKNDPYIKKSLVKPEPDSESDIEPAVEPTVSDNENDENA